MGGPNSLSEDLDLIPNHDPPVIMYCPMRTPLYTVYGFTAQLELSPEVASKSLRTTEILLAFKR